MEDTSPMSASTDVWSVILYWVIASRQRAEEKKNSTMFISTIADLTVVSKQFNEATREAEKRLEIDWLVYCQKFNYIRASEYVFMKYDRDRGCSIDKAVKMAKTIAFYHQTELAIRKEVDAFMGKHGIHARTKSGKIYKGRIPMSMKNLNKIKVTPKSLDTAFKSLTTRHLEINKKRSRLRQSVRDLFECRSLAQIYHKTL